jgi:ATP-dependent Clp protease ATP-binding subunit ClpC
LLANVPITVTFERYTPEARKALFFSRYEASQAGSTTIEPEHLLLGLIRVGEAVVGQFGRSGLSLQPARSALVVQAAEPIPSSTMIPVSDRVRPVFGAAAQEADRQQHQSIGLVHLLLGVLRDGDSAAAGWLAARGVRAESIRADIMSWLDERPEA